ncbi:MAG: ABC transporter permease subunit [Burkholderiaceae bacterium]
MSQPDPQLDSFVVTDAAYWQQQFDRIGRAPGIPRTFNPRAILLGPIWFGMRAIWHWALAFLLVETLAWVQIVRGLFGDLAADAWRRIGEIEGTLDLRRRQLEAAIERQADNVDVYRRTVKSLEDAIGSIRLEAQSLADSGLRIALAGVALLLVIRLVQAVLANPLLARRYHDWLSDPAIDRGMSRLHIGFSIVFVLTVIIATAVHYSFPGLWPMLADFPTHPEIRLTAIGWVENFFALAIRHGEAFFDLVTLGIRIVLDALELVFVQTPWIVIFGLIVLATGLSAGRRAAIFSGAFLAYMGLLGFWEKAMTTLALLGTAACLSIVIGIPLGMYCARRPRLYAAIRPIMDFMQTMPAFVFMIPVIAFFGTGKPAAVVTTMIFGGTPVVRLTVLGLQGVPEHVREAAIAYGASKWYLLSKVDLPLASPSIRAGINQTIMLSLAMVVVASLIGAKGLGEDVLEALQYANVGQGILAGFAILFCAIMLDRIVQGARR